MADDNSSSESDDEFLTVGNKRKGIVDREALIRKKLLESFYGQTGDGSPANAAQPRRIASSKSEENKNPSHARGSAADFKDLDSPYFNVDSHTRSHVESSTVHDLLEFDEQLTLQVRTLDSTTQNMVYENYSKFIDGTAAISSVGVNVQANEQGLERLMKGMATINEKSKSVEEELGSLRDAVAEKIRVKRLLTRLDALLKLPETLREQIVAGNYRQAAIGFCRSTTILSKHSEGFESLQKIETECNAILLDMVKEMKRKLRHWSGQDNSSFVLQSMSEDTEGSPKPGSLESLDVSDQVLEPPNSISDIFECAGTLVLLMKERPIDDLDPGVSLTECERMSIVASTRLVERLLDTHQLEVQEAAMGEALMATADDEGADFERPAFHLIPTHVLDGGILKTAALFRMSFKGDKDIQAQEFGDGTDRLEAFVEDSFASFLSHVKSILLEHTLGTQASQESLNGGQDADGNDGYVDIAGAMATLLSSVRELASALSLPEIGIRPDVASGLVEQAADLSDTLVRGRVDRMMCELRLRVVNDCLAPFADRAVAGKVNDADASGEVLRFSQVVQIAVSDCMQLLDDTIRSIVSGRDDLGASIDLQALKQAIQSSTCRFAAWLAGSLELLAGCDTSDPYFSFEASGSRLTPLDSISPGNDPSGPVQRGGDFVVELSNQFEALNARVDDALQELAVTLDRKRVGLKSYDVVLQLFEMCRNCESSIVDAMRQSIETNVGGGKRGRSSGLFPIDKKNVALSLHEKSSVTRFRLAGSRILTLYCTYRGFDAAHYFLCTPLSESEAEKFPDGPSIGLCRALDIAKQVSSDCSKLGREEKRAGPLPDFSSVSALSQPMLGRIAAPVKGLQLHVERMFQEKISIYPHPNDELEFSRDAALTLMFLVVINAAAEQARQRTFSCSGYARLLMDMEFLREMIPHYVNEKCEVQGSKACSALSSQCSDALNNARDRCQDEDLPENETLIRRAREALKGYMIAHDANHSFIITG